jgi:asparagine synthase (glutamine-hydrolysing)
MCGIAGICSLNDRAEISMDTLISMSSVLRHRGPDGMGIYRDDGAGLAHTRLSIIDLEGGQQPIYNEDRSVVISFNGEIFNYIELRKELEERGHIFSTRTDTEVIVHLYEEHGTGCLEHLNGQFAFAIWDKKEKCLLLARDRVGIRPLFYTIVDGCLLFASEIKALFTADSVRREISHRALEQVFTFWVTIPPETAFKGIFELPAGHFMTVRNGNRKVEEYWDLDFSHSGRMKTEDEYAEKLRELLMDAVRLRLRADVPVGAYLSGGIDSSVVTALIKNYTDNRLRTFSVTFQDEAFDERGYQKEVIDHLDTDHSDIQCAANDIGRIFPEVIWHTEKPILRTAPAPLYMLSSLVRRQGYKVVLTGEGSDEVLTGYDIFKEAKIRRFLARFPQSRLRPLILKRLYPYLENSPTPSIEYGRSFFDVVLDGCPEEYSSHVPRWKTTSMTRRFFSDGLKEELANQEILEDLLQVVDPDMSKYDDLSRAQYLEIKTLLSGYILSSQGDRMAMAHSVEGRFPFLDHRVMEFCAKLPPNLRMKVLNEKYLLKKAMYELLPPSIVRRKKQPYMAPDSKSFFKSRSLDYLDGLLSPANLRRTGYFHPDRVSLLIKKCRHSPVIGFKDNMAAVGIISTLLLHDLFIDNFESRANRLEDGVPKEQNYAIRI